MTMNSAAKITVADAITNVLMSIAWFPFSAPARGVYTAMQHKREDCSPDIPNALSIRGQIIGVPQAGGEVDGLPSFPSSWLGLLNRIDPALIFHKIRVAYFGPQPRKASALAKP